jgi:molybdate transport system substrate-binding protein
MPILLLLAAAHAIAPHPLRIAAAANLSGALEEVVRGWMTTCAQRACEARVTYGASGTLAAQIQNGAPFDLFLAADAVYPQKIAEAGAAEGAPFIYARGKLALWVPAESKLPIESEGLRALRDPSVGRIAIANPQLAPYGRLAMDDLKAAGLDDPRRLVLGESVGQAAQLAQSGGVQAALLPMSLAMRMPGRHVELQGSLEQGGVVLRSGDGKLARTFVDFLLSGEGRKILGRHGYAP